MRRSCDQPPLIRFILCSISQSSRHSESQNNWLALTMLSHQWQNPTGINDDVVFLWCSIANSRSRSSRSDAASKMSVISLSRHRPHNRLQVRRLGLQRLRRTVQETPHGFLPVQPRWHPNTQFWACRASVRAARGGRAG